MALVKQTSIPSFEVTLSQEETECLAALLFSTLCLPAQSPLYSLVAGLGMALEVDDDDLKILSVKYKRFVG